MSKRTRNFTAGWALVALGLCVVLCGDAFAADKLTKIADNVYSYVDTKGMAPQNSYGANAGIVIGDDGVLVVDTLISAKEAKRFLKDIRAVTHKPILYVVNTHYHLDHAWGNAEFAKLGAKIILQEKDAANLRNLGPEGLKNAKGYGLTPEDMKGTELAYAKITFGDHMAIDLGGTMAELLYLGPTHTSGSLVVYVPSAKVLFTGDLLFTGSHPYLAEGDIDAWSKQLDAVKAMDVDKYVPGHGPLSTKQDVEDMKNYLLLFDQKAKELAAKSNDADHIAQELKKALPERPELSGLILGNVTGKYLKK